MPAHGSGKPTPVLNTGDTNRRSSPAGACKPLHPTRCRRLLLLPPAASTRQVAAARLSGVRAGPGWRQAPATQGLGIRLARCSQHRNTYTPHAHMAGRICTASNSLPASVRRCRSRGGSRASAAAPRRPLPSRPRRGSGPAEGRVQRWVISRCLRCKLRTAVGRRAGRRQGGNAVQRRRACTCVVPPSPSTSAARHRTAYSTAPVPYSTRTCPSSKMSSDMKHRWSPGPGRAAGSRAHRSATGRGTKGPLGGLRRAGRRGRQVRGCKLCSGHSLGAVVSARCSEGEAARCAGAATAPRRSLTTHLAGSCSYCSSTDGLTGVLGPLGVPPWPPPAPSSAFRLAPAPLLGRGGMLACWATEPSSVRGLAARAPLDRQSAAWGAAASQAGWSRLPVIAQREGITAVLI